jgi:V/A-type H+-transporting ATPase subunit K
MRGFALSSTVRGALALTALTVVVAGAATVLLMLALPAAAQTAPASPGAGLPAEAVGWALMAAALATGVSSLAGGYAVAKLGTAAVGTLAEKPELFGRLLIFVGLAEGIAIYGVIISILILNRLGGA